jgi:hypothetical protein
MLPAFDYTIRQVRGFDSLPVASLSHPSRTIISHSGKQIIHRPAS